MACSTVTNPPCGSRATAAMALGAGERESGIDEQWIALMDKSSMATGDLANNAATRPLAFATSILAIIESPPDRHCSIVFPSLSRKTVPSAVATRLRAPGSTIAEKASISREPSWAKELIGVLGQPSLSIRTARTRSCNVSIPRPSSVERLRTGTVSEGASTASDFVHALDKRAFTTGGGPSIGSVSCSPPPSTGPR